MSNPDTEFIKWLESHEAWYEKQSDKWSRWLNGCKVISLVASLASIVVAAASSETFFSGAGRWLIVAATTLTAFSSETLAQLKVREMEELREDGHLEAAAIVAYARQKFDEFGDDRSRINQVKDEVRERVATLERRQHRRYVAIDGKAAARKPQIQ
jgi:hypothetical protein